MLHGRAWPTALRFAVCEQHRGFGEFEQRTRRAALHHARAEMGLVLGLRQRHLDPIIGEATRQLETETKLMCGGAEGFRTA